MKYTEYRNKVITSGEEAFNAILNRKHKPFEIKNKTLIVHSNPIKGTSGEFAITDPEVYANWPKTMDEFFIKYDKDIQRLKENYKIENIIRLDKQ